MNIFQKNLKLREIILRMFEVENRIFAIQESRALQHKNFEGAFSIHEDFEKYRTQIDQITTEMKKLSAEATEVRIELLSMSKEELAQIVFDIQKQEEELLIIRFRK